MGSILTNGVFLPAEGERNCYDGLASNWTILDGVVGGYSSHAANLTIHVTAADKAKWDAVTGKADSSALTAHTANTTIHVTAADKAAWNGKADSSALTAHTGDTTIHVTAADKTKWDGKANDNDVVHKTGNETISGNKTFTDNNTIKTSSPKVLLINSSLTGNTPPSSNTASFLRFDGGTVNNFGGVQCEFLTTGENRLTNYVNDITKAKVNTIQQRASSTTAMTVFNADLLVPSTDGVTVLGNSSKHWSDVQTYKVNGINPGALFLPQDRSARVDISAYFTNTASGDSNQMTAPADGWIYMSLSNITVLNMSSNTSGGLTNYADSRFRATAGSMLITFPVSKNDIFKTTWYTDAAAIGVTAAVFIPAKGNT